MIQVWDEQHALDWPVSGVQMSADPNSVEFVIDNVPVADGTPHCDAFVSVTSVPRHNEDTWVSVGLNSFLTYPGREQADCVLETQLVPYEFEVRVDTIDRIMIDKDYGREAQAFYRSSDGFAECALPLCDPATGRDAPAPGCDTIRRDIEGKRVGLDLPKRTSWRVLECDGADAEVEVDIGTAACAAGDRSCDRRVRVAHIRLADSGFWDVHRWD